LSFRICRQRSPVGEINDNEITGDGVKGQANKWWARAGYGNVPQQVSIRPKYNQVSRPGSSAVPVEIKGSDVNISVRPNRKTFGSLRSRWQLRKQLRSRVADATLSPDGRSAARNNKHGQRHSPQTIA